MKAPDPIQQVGAELVLRFIERAAARHVFGLPGSNSVPIFHGIPSSKLTFVPSLQEGAALAMADGYARFAGPTAVLLYMFPGVATAASSLYNAFRDETPLIVIASQQSTQARWPFGSVGETDLVGMVSPYTRFAHEVGSPARLPRALEAAFRAATGPANGPSFVAIPEDFLHAPAPPLTDFGIRERAAAASVGAIAKRLHQARRPTIIVGGQLRRMGGSEAIETLADHLNIPILYEPFWNDRLGVSPGHRCALGVLTERSALGSEADFVLAVGCRMFNEIHPRQDAWFRPDTFVVHVNADVDKVEQIHTVSWSCVADCGLFAHQLLQAARRETIDDKTQTARAARLEEAKARRKRPRSGPYTEAVEAIAENFGNAYLVDESVSGNYPLVSALGGTRGDRYVSTTGGSLGWGIGSACGVALATEEPVTCVLGDGAFFFGLQGLWHAALMKLPITFVVLDNGGFGSTKYFESAYAKTLNTGAVPHFVGSDFAGIRPSITEVARSFGVPSQDVADGDELRRLLRRPDQKGPLLARIAIAE